MEEEWLQYKLMDLAASTARAARATLLDAESMWKLVGHQDADIVCDAGINVCLCVLYVLCMCSASITHI